MWLSNSSIGRKVVMSVTGIALVLFLTFHMAMNLVALFSEDAYNMICEFLGANWYALVATAGLAALFVIHIIYAFWLTMQNRAARGSERYAVNVKPKTVEWASQNMLVLGIVVIAGLALHFANFFTVLYLIWLAALWFHLTHGFWSALQTLGWSNKIWFERWKTIGNIYSTLVVLGFAAVVVIYFVKSLACGAC